MRTFRLWPLALLIFLLAATACSSQASGASGNGATAGLEVVFGTDPAPARLGQVDLHVDIYDVQRKPVDDAQVTFKATMEGHSMGELSGPATAQGNGRYATRANLSMAGEWVIDVRVRTADQDVQRKFRFAVQ